MTETEILELYRSLPPEEQQEIISYLNEIAEKK